MLKAVIFDIDGVLVDSQRANGIFFQNLLVKAGYPKPTRQAVEACFHLPMRTTIAKLTGADSEEVERIWHLGLEKSLRDNSAAHYQFPLKLEHTLEALHKKYKLGIVTSRVQVGVQQIFEIKEIAHLFDVVVAFDDVQNTKPHPEPLLLALKKLKLKPEEAVYIGDSDSDIIAATAAGMRSVHLTQVAHKDATASIAEFDELLAAIEPLL